MIDLARFSYKTLLVLISLGISLSACTVGPDYRRPNAPLSANYKELTGWKAANPADAHIPSDWWQVFKDPYLHNLVSQVSISNQALAQAEAQFRQAQSLVQGARAAYYPTATATATTNRFRAATGQSVAVSGVRSLFGTAVSIAWEPDIWGNIRRQVEANQASAQASFATLQALRLSTQTSLVQNYIQLRALDAQQALLSATEASYHKTLDITQNRYSVGVSAKTELLQAKTQLESLQAQTIDLGVQRAKLEHAIAILLGKPPAELRIPVQPLQIALPPLPSAISAELLERRPDIAAAERQVAAANAQIGVAKAAYFPTVNLTATNGFQSGTLSNLISTATRYWALGPAAFALPLFDGGAKAAQMSSTIAAYDANVAAYRQVVLTGLQEVEDQLATLRIMAQEAALQQQAVDSANAALTLSLNQYKAGIISYLEVMTIQITALNNQKAALAVYANRLEAAVLLIKSLGGGWSRQQMPKANEVGGEATWSQFLPIPLH